MPQTFDYDSGFVYASQFCMIVFPTTALKVKRYVCGWTDISLPQLTRARGAVAEERLLWFLRMHFSHPGVSVSCFLWQGINNDPNVHFLSTVRGGVKVE